MKFDFDVIDKFFPKTPTNMDYRVIDISSIGELVRHWNPEARKAMPAKASDHKSMTDIRAGIDGVRYSAESVSLLESHLQRLTQPLG